MTFTADQQALHERALAALTEAQRAQMHPYVLAHLLPLPTTAAECRVVFGDDAVANFQRGVMRQAVLA